MLKICSDNLPKFPGFFINLFRIFWKLPRNKKGAKRFFSRREGANGCTGTKFSSGLSFFFMFCSSKLRARANRCNLLFQEQWPSLSLKIQLWKYVLAVRSQNLYWDFAKADMFSGSIRDDRAQNKISIMKCLHRMANNVQACSSTPIGYNWRKKNYEFQN